MTKKKKYLKRLFIAAFLSLLSLLAGGSSMGSYAFYLTDWEHTILVAHRGGASSAPENTCAALLQAIDAGIPMAEIDVQQTRDGVLIVMHDNSFLRTAGLNRKVWDTDYEVVQILDAGLHFSPHYAGEPVPSLEDMLLLARNRIVLMIELKSSGNDENLVESTLQLIAACGMEHQCMIASMNLELLKQSKELAPEMETVFISSQPLSNVSDLSYVDAYSLKHNILTREFVEQAHEEGKAVYAWTVNSKKAALNSLAMEVDGIITDDLWLDIR